MIYLLPRSHVKSVRLRGPSTQLMYRRAGAGSAGRRSRHASVQGFKAARSRRSTHTQAALTQPATCPNHPGCTTVCISAHQRCLAADPAVERMHEARSGEWAASRQCAERRACAWPCAPGWRRQCSATRWDQRACATLPSQSVQPAGSAPWRRARSASPARWRCLRAPLGPAAAR